MASFAHKRLQGGKALHFKVITVANLSVPTVTKLLQSCFEILKAISLKN